MYSPTASVQSAVLSAEYSQTTFSFKQTQDQLVPSCHVDKYHFRTDIRTPKTGLLIVGLGGNNGTTVAAGIIANRQKIAWNTKQGVQQPNYLGSLTQSSSVKLGLNEDKKNQVSVLVKDLVPLVNPNDLVIGGWDLNSDDLFKAMQKAAVIDYDLQVKLRPFMQQISPMKAIFYRGFIASNQDQRANNLKESLNKLQDLNSIRTDIRKFKEENQLQKVVVVWSANTQKMSPQVEGVHDTADNLLKALAANSPEVSPSTVYALAAIFQDCAYVNGSPQNTLVPGVVQAADNRKCLLVGSDFKTGQTKFKSCFTDFLVSAGIKPRSIVSYNHLGNNDGKNLSEEGQLRSKESSKKDCVSQILKSSGLFKEDQSIDHTVVIKYVPSAGDSKKAIDQYESSIFMNGRHLFTSYNVCQDSLLAAPLIIDLALLVQFFSRVSFSRDGINFQSPKGLLNSLSYFMKNPKVSGPVGSSLWSQRQRLCNLLKITMGWGSQGLRFQGLF